MLARDAENNKVLRSFEHDKLEEEVACLLTWVSQMLLMKSFWMAFSEELSSFRLLSFKDWDRGWLFLAYFGTMTETLTTACLHWHAMQTAGLGCRCWWDSSSKQSCIFVFHDVPGLRGSQIYTFVGHCECAGSKQQSSGCASGRGQAAKFSLICTEHWDTLACFTGWTHLRSSVSTWYLAEELGWLRRGSIFQLWFALCHQSTW